MKAIPALRRQSDGLNVCCHSVISRLFGYHGSPISAVLIAAV